MFFNIVAGQEIYLKRITIDDGLPSNEIYQVLQDDAGNLLAATDRGAVRFDGYSFETIKLNNEQSSYPVYYIYKSPQGKIFFSGLKGYLYNYSPNGLFNYSYNQKIASLFKHSGLLVANTLSYYHDSLWISYNNDFNFNFDIGSGVVMPNGDVKKLIREDGIYFDFPRNFFYRQLSATSPSNAQPLFITWKDGSFTKDTVNLSWLSGYIRRLYYEHVAGYDLFCIGRNVLIYKNKKRIGTFHVKANILTFTVMEGNLIYLGFENGGASVYQLNNGNINGPIRNYLKDLTVTCIFKDNQGGVWFSTQETGLFYSHPTVTKYWENESRIVCIEKNKNEVYVGYRSGLIQIFYEGLLREEIKFPKDKANFYNFSFYNDSLIVITGNGYYLWQKTKWKFYPTHSINLLQVSSNVVYAAASSYPELYIYNGLGGELLQKNSLPKRIISMLYDSRKELWLGTWEGLYKYNSTSIVNLTASNAVFQDRITSIKELGDNTLAVSSLGSGLAIYKNGKSHILNMSNGLITPVINSMEVDGDTIWLGTNKGLTKVIFKDQKFTVHHFGLESGLPTLDIHEFTIVKGQLYLKWINRLVTISFDKLSTIPGRVTINSVIVNDEKMDSLGNDSYNYKQNEFQFNFNSINLAGANQQEYHYILEGLDNKWYRSKERYAKYTNLSPGNYSFKVQAVSGLKGKPTDLAIYNFTIVPALWDHWWFYLLVIGAILLLSFFIFRNRLVYVKRKNQLLLDLADSQQKALVQLINPHFIFNILNTIQGAILKQDKITAASLISRFAKLMRLSMELSKEKFVKLEKEAELLNKYFELESIRSPDKFSYEIRMESMLNPSEFNIPSMLVQPFVENSIKHGITHLSNKKGFIHINYAFKNNELICTIDDNGIGRKNSEVINKNMRSEHQSTGIEITLTRLKLLHKERGTNYFYLVKDKMDASGMPEGTTIIFSLPFKTNHETNTRPDH